MRVDAKYVHVGLEESDLPTMQLVLLPRARQVSPALRSLTLTAVPVMCHAICVFNNEMIHFKIGLALGERLALRAAQSNPEHVMRCTRAAAPAESRRDSHVADRDTPHELRYPYWAAQVPSCQCTHA